MKFKFYFLFLFNSTLIPAYLNEKIVESEIPLW